MISLLSFSILLLDRNSLNIFSPLEIFSRLSFRKAAVSLVLAFAVVTSDSHSSLGVWDFEVNISTWSPLCSFWLKGTSLWFTFAAMQWKPRSECRVNARSSAVASVGSVIRSPLGVKTKISVLNKFSLIVSRKSIAFGSGCSSISLIVFNHTSNSDSSSESPTLYFQCAAKPRSAISSIFSLRICTSIQFPSGPITVR